MNCGCDYPDSALVPRGVEPELAGAGAPPAVLKARPLMLPGEAAFAKLQFSRS